MSELTDTTIQSLRDARAKGSITNLLKAAGITVASNLTSYDLEATAKNLFTVLTPLLKELPTEKGKGGDATHWKAVTAVNTTKQSIGVSEGNRNAFISITTKAYTAAYKEVGMDSFVTFAADEAAEGFDDVKDVNYYTMLSSLLIEEEAEIFGGNTSIALGTCGTPTLSDNTADGGTIPETTTLKVYCVALTPDGLRKGPSIGDNTYYKAVTGDVLFMSYTRTNADGSTDVIAGFNGQISAVASITTDTDGNNAHTVSASVTPVVGAVAYAWLVGPTTGAGALFYGISSVANIKIQDAVGAGTTAANNAGLASDLSQDDLIYDGLLSLINGAAQGDGDTSSGAYRNVLANGTPGTGTPLTGNGAAGVNEIETAFKHFWTRYRLSPDKIWVNAQQMLDITNLVLPSGGSSLVRFNVDPHDATRMIQAGVAGGLVIGSYLNKFGAAIQGQGNTTGRLIPIVIHPNCPPGTMVFTTYKLPYPLPKVPNLIQFKTRRDYYGLDYPVVSRKWTYGTYRSGVLQSYAPFSLGLITNIASTN